MPQKTISRVPLTEVAAPGELVEPMKLGMDEDGANPSNALKRQEISATQIEVNNAYAPTRTGEGLIPGDLVSTMWLRRESQNVIKEVGIYMGPGKVAVTHQATFPKFSGSSEEIYHKKEKPVVVDLNEREGNLSVNAIRLRVRGGDR